MSTMTKMCIVWAMAVVLCVAFSGAVLAAEKAKEPAKAAKTTVKPYPLDTCIISGQKLGEMGKPVVITYKGREIKFCCPACKPKFDKDPEKYLKKIDELAAKQKAAASSPAGKK